jgi:hypothetical protein
MHHQDQTTNASAVILALHFRLQINLNAIIELPTTGLSWGISGTPALHLPTYRTP